MAEMDLSAVYIPVVPQLDVAAWDQIGARIREIIAQAVRDGIKDGLTEQ
jgi:hypothetical protein